MKRYLGLDLGEKNVGLALSDPLGMIAQPYSVIVYEGKRDLLAQVKEIVEKEKVNGLVAGLPLSKDGSRGPIAEKIQHLADFLKENLALPLAMIDERFTSQGAQAMLRGEKMSREKHKKLTQQMSASLILQTFLESGKKL